jgi:hypothetical protein
LRDRGSLANTLQDFWQGFLAGFLAGFLGKVFEGINGMIAQIRRTATGRA